MRALRWLQDEHRLCLRANRWGHRRAVRAYFAAVSRAGDGGFWYALMAGCLLLGGWAGVAAAAHMAATGATALLLYTLLKRWTRRPRPFASDRRIHPLVAPLDEFSFPSGHTLQAVSFSAVALAHEPLLAWLLLPFTASVAVSRVVLGLHYPSDVLAASALGGALAAVSVWLGGLAGLLPG